MGTYLSIHRVKDIKIGEWEKGHNETYNIKKIRIITKDGITEISLFGDKHEEKERT